MDWIAEEFKRAQRGKLDALLALAVADGDELAYRHQRPGGRAHAQLQQRGQLAVPG